MKRLEDFADDPLVPALLAKVHEQGDKKLMNVRHSPTSSCFVVFTDITHAFYFS